LAPGSDLSVPYETEFVGATQIVDPDGTVLASRRTTEGPGIVSADVELGARGGVMPVGEDFWIPDLPLLVRGYWHQQNLAGRSYYRRSGRTAGLRAATGD
ncbi:carbon-nitrogen hydrolase family protein, partial [Dietzia sp. NPDC055343]